MQGRYRYKRFSSLSQKYQYILSINHRGSGLILIFLSCYVLLKCWWIAVICYSRRQNLSLPWYTTELHRNAISWLGIAAPYCLLITCATLHGKCRLAPNRLSVPKDNIVFPSDIQLTVSIGTQIYQYRTHLRNVDLQMVLYMHFYISWLTLYKFGTWWRHQMETFPHYWPFVQGIHRSPVTRTFDVFFDLRLNKRLSKQWWRWLFETLSRPLWRHPNEHKLPGHPT